MKKLLALLLVFFALTATARATDVAIGPSTIPGFNPASVPADVTLMASVIGGSPTVTSASKFSPWVGLGGFRISILGVPYTVAYVTNASTLTLTTNYAAGDNPTATVVWYKYVELRIYPDSAFQPFGKTYIVQPGTPGSGAWYRRVAASIVNEFGINNLYIPQLTLDATTDSLTNQSARYFAAFYRPGGSFIQNYECFDSFSLQPTGSTTWPDICLFNSQQVIVQDSTTYTKQQIDAMRTGCTIGQSLFYAVTGLKPDCLNFGGGLLLTGNTLSATAGSSYTTVANNGTPLTQRTVLNFLAPGLIATDNAGATRTEVNLDSDLNALASNATNGFWAAGTNIARTLTGTANEIAITNGNGTVGNPVLSLPSALTFTGKTVTGGTYAGISALGIRSSGGGAFDLQISNTETLTANRNLTFTLNDAARTVNLGGNLTTANAFTTSGNFALTLTQTGATNVTLPTTGILATLAGTETLTNKTLTSPRIGVALLDTNGNEVLETPATASAVNQLRATNSATGNPVSVSAQGDDANVQLNLNSKGTSSVALQTGGTDRIVVTNTPEVYAGNGVTNASPAGVVVLGTGGSGTNIAGANLDLSGGKGTGNAVPGQVGVRYPLIGASGSTLQSLSTNRFPVVTSTYTITGFGSSIVNTVTETSLFTGVTVSSGSTRTIEAGSARAGTVYYLRIEGIYGATGAPTGRIRYKIGSTLITDTTAFTVPAVGTGLFIIDVVIQINAIGATGQVAISAPRAEFIPGLSGVVAPSVAYAGSFATVDFTANKDIEVTWQWGTADAANTITARTIKIIRER